MDPANNAPTANEPSMAPDAPAADSQPANMVNPVNPAAAAAMAGAPANPNMPPVNADVANAALNPPTNPVVTPGANAGVPGVGAPAAGGTMSMNQMFQSQPTQNGGLLDDTTPIAVPEGPKPVDPVEEELKAPLKAAEPAPGSIGSAVSGPADANSPQNVAFSDPAVENPMTANAAAAVKKPSLFAKIMTKTKMTKSTLTLLIVVAGLIIVVLVAVLVMLMTGIL